MAGGIPMGLMDSIMEGIIGAGQAAGFIYAVALAGLAWPLVTTGTKAVLVAMVGSATIDTLLFPENDADQLTVGLGIGVGLVYWGAMS